VYFTICGSSQELHEKYRKGSNLQTIIDNAMAFKNINKNDYIQHILFEYNKNDLYSMEMKKIIEKFNNVNYTETYFTRDITTYRDISNLSGLLIPSEKQKKYKYIDKLALDKFKQNAVKKNKIKCPVMNQSCHINQFGKIYPCYIFLEESGVSEWNMKYDDILNFSYKCCRFCEHNIIKLQDVFESDQIL
jgi:hypothetical protein